MHTLEVVVDAVKRGDVRVAPAGADRAVHANREAALIGSDTVLIECVAARMVERAVLVGIWKDTPMGKT